MLHLLFLCPLLFAYSSFGFIFFVTQYNCTAVLGSPGEVRGFRGRWGWVGECEEVYPPAFHSFGVLAVQIHCWRRPCPLLQGKCFIGKKKQTIFLEYRSSIKPGTMIALDCVLCSCNLGLATLSKQLSLVSFYFPLKPFLCLIWFEPQEGNEEALHFDAHVLEVQRKQHDIRGCRCIFLVEYDHDRSQVFSTSQPCSSQSCNRRLLQLLLFLEVLETSLWLMTGEGEPEKTVPASKVLLKAGLLLSLMRIYYKMCFYLELTGMGNLVEVRGWTLLCPSSCV